MLGFWPRGSKKERWDNEIGAPARGLSSESNLTPWAPGSQNPVLGSILTAQRLADRLDLCFLEDVVLGVDGHHQDVDASQFLEVCLSHDADEDLIGGLTFEQRSFSLSAAVFFTTPVRSVT
jgi:hypothetical protein